MQMYKLVFSVVILSVGFIGFTVFGNQSDSNSRFGAGGSKFVSVSEDKRYEKKWRLPSVSEVSFYVASWMGGFGGQKEKNPKVLHDQIAGQVKQGLEIADQFGVPTGPTAFDGYFDSQPKPGARWEKVD